ncbi:hypothetical protein K6Y31_08645 [Motilimonas cestriensis]|uniref:Lipoprotein n=1 Tax=Motilimonas cestriensis TaxID=2742685 RepID=A0ABS8WBB7_9GAMM|nr:hypothetical protein [Motilimonas cestriensis]MCE2594881.1 hypothetical protein [Motilimonas cestriensis]
MCQLVVILSIAAGTFGCDRKINQLGKADFDIKALDAHGLLNGVAVDFEFCVANSDAVMEQVKASYPDLQFMAASRGRIDCDVRADGKGEQVLVIGSTHVPKYREHFSELLASDEIAVVKRVYWE